MELEAAKVIGAGLAVIGVIGSGIGIGSIFSSFIVAPRRGLHHDHAGLRPGRGDRALRAGDRAADPVRLIRRAAVDATA
jgi:hypothetical protein